MFIKVKYKEENEREVIESFELVPSTFGQKDLKEKEILIHHSQVPVAFYSNWDQYCLHQGILVQYKR